jgi:DNA polymerase sigma
MEYIIENIVTLEEWKEFKKYQKMCHKEERWVKNFCYDFCKSLKVSESEIELVKYIFDGIRNISVLIILFLGFKEFCKIFFYTKK